VGLFGLGEVLRENERMLQLCRELGFELSSSPVDAALVHVAKRLT